MAFPIGCCRHDGADGVEVGKVLSDPVAMTQATGPLAGIRVLDLTAVVLGPYATQTLGDWGADVIKIEPLHGDTVRNSGLFKNKGMASVFLQINRNKRSVALDLKSATGKEVIRRLIPKMDVLVSNIRPAGMEPPPDLRCRHRLWPGWPLARPSRVRRNHPGGERFRLRDG